MKIVVVGCGGVGGYFGGRLAQNGMDVTFLARGKQLKQLQRDGLEVISIKGDFKVKPVQVAGNLQEVGIADLVLIAVKTWQLDSLMSDLKSLIGPKTLFIPLQNGVETPKILARELGTEHVVGGYCRIISSTTQTGVIRHLGAEPSIFFGRLDGQADDRLSWLKQQFSAAGVTCELSKDIVADMWRKFLFVVPVGGLGAITRQPFGIFREVPESRALLQEAMEEILTLARRLGIALDEQMVTETMAFVDSLPHASTSSLQRDLEQQQPSELEDWSGAVVRMAREQGMDAPVHRAIYAALLPSEILARKQHGLL